MTTSQISSKRSKPISMVPFLHPITVLPSDIDELGHVNNVVYVRWIQEVSAAHWHTVVPGELRSRYLWVVLRHEIDYKLPAVLNDTITGSTWVGTHRGARFERFVSIRNQGGKEIVAAKTLWCMLDAPTMRPTRISEEVLRFL